jgi:hypothetical protein
MLAELGLPGFLGLALVILGLLAAAFNASRRLRHGRTVSAGLVAATLVFCIQAAGDWLWKVPAIVVLAAGCVIALTGADGDPRASGFRTRRRVGLAGFALAAGVLMIPGIVSTQLVRDSETLAAAGKDARAIGAAHTAVSAEPWSASAHSTLAGAEIAAGHMRAARGAARRAIELDPDNWFNRLLLGVIEFKVGHRDASLQAFREAAVLDSKNPASVSIRFARREARHLTGASALPPG